MGDKHNISKDTHKEHLSALESINASFAIRKEEAARENKKLEPSKRNVELSGTLDRINASYAEAVKTREKETKSSGTKIDWVWNLTTGILITALIIAAVVFIVLIYRGTNLEEGNTNNTPAVQLSDSEGQTEAESGEADSNSSVTATEGETDPEAESGGEETEVTSRTVPEEYASILTDNEKEEWKSRETDNSRLFVQMNQKLNITDVNKVYLRLINPPYSAFDIQIKIYTQDDPDKVLYQSDIIEPGTILEYAEFDSIPEPGEYTAGVEYTVYDEKGNKIGTHEVAVDIAVQEQQEAARQ